MNKSYYCLKHDSLVPWEKVLPVQGVKQWGVYRWNVLENGNPTTQTPLSLAICLPFLG